MFENRCCIVGVTGGIAAFKAATLVGLLKKRGADVRVIMTRNATEFVTPLTFETLSGNPVVTDMFDRKTTWEVEHVSLAAKADLFVVAPATADFIGKAAAGVADDMLLTTLLAARCPVVIAPAMNVNMLADMTVRDNLRALKRKGYCVMDTDAGMLACGETGEGRMKEPEEILSCAMDVFSKGRDMAGIKVLVTAGPTREWIDPVRFISSPSTGKMGFAVAAAAANRGAAVTLVTGPVSMTPPLKTNTVGVETAQEMYDAVTRNFDDTDMVIMTAAVADYCPAQAQAHKIKKDGDLNIELVRTTDILLALGRTRRHQMLIGFAAETRDVEAYAIKKLKEKNLDMIAANDVGRCGCGFAVDTNHIVLYKKDGTSEDFGMLGKTQAADRLLDAALAWRKNPPSR